MQQLPQPPEAVVIPSSPPSELPDSGAEPPHRQLVVAMNCLADASRVLGDMRLGADRLYEGVIDAVEPHQSNNPVNFMREEEASMHQYLQDLQAIGKQLEDSGVINESLPSRRNSRSFHMPLECPDGAVPDYSWQRQLTVYDCAYTGEKSRLALKAFTNQKRRFFPHLDDRSRAEFVCKKHCGAKASTWSDHEELSDLTTVSDLILSLQEEELNVKFFSYQRLDWLKRASSLPSSCDVTSLESSQGHGFCSSNAADKIAVIELLVPSIFRAVISLHAATCVDPDAVAFFSPDEGGSYVHAWGISVYHVFRLITEHAALALQYFIGIATVTALRSLLYWICSYQTLFTKVCSKCGWLISRDEQLGLPPVRRPYRNFLVGCSTNDAYHVGCYSEEA